MKRRQLSPLKIAPGQHDDDEKTRLLEKKPSPIEKYGRLTPDQNPFFTNIKISEDEVTPDEARKIMRPTSLLIPIDKLARPMK